jgi:hypothetical protein
MSIAGKRSRVAGKGFYGPAVCGAFLETLDQFPVLFAGKMQEKWGGDPRTRHRAMISLTGWVAARISLTVNQRLRTALDNVEGSSAFEQLLQGIAGATAIEWATLEREEPLAVLVTRTALRLKKEGDDTTKLHGRGKQEGGRLDSRLGMEETDLADLEGFRMREELRATRTYLAAVPRRSPTREDLLTLPWARWHSSERRLSRDGAS